jgi:hypothetical protein
MLQIHPNARTTPATRAEIARSTERSGVLARRYGVSPETIRKGRQRGAADCLDHAARPHRLVWKASEEARAVVCALRRATNFALDDLTFVVGHFLPHLNQHSAIAFLRAAAAAFPFRLTHVLTDNGSCFTPAFAKVCAGPAIQPRPA